MSIFHHRVAKLSVWWPSGWRASARAERAHLHGRQYEGELARLLGSASENWLPVSTGSPIENVSLEKKYL